MSKHALIVDDCAFTTKYLSRCLNDLGYVVTSSPSGESAIEQLSSGLDVDVILIDWVMPGMSGTELLSWLRSQPQFAATPTLMVTAQAELEHVAEALQKGANEYIIKPFTRESVTEKLLLIGIPIADTRV